MGVRTCAYWRFSAGEFSRQWPLPVATVTALAMRLRFGTKARICPPRLWPTQ